MSHTLERQHAEVYRELVETADELLRETSKAKYRDEVEVDLRSGTLHDDLASVGGTQESLEKNKQRFLEAQLHTRLKVLEQHLETYPLLRAIHGDSGIYEKRLLDLVNAKDAKNLEAVKEIKKNAKLRKDLGGVRVESLGQLDVLRDKVKYYRKVCEEVDELKKKRDRQGGALLEDFDRLDTKRKLLVRKDQVLSQFVLNLIASVGTADLNDEVIREMVMYCGDYEEYGE